MNKYDSFNEAYLDLIQHVLDYGKEVTPRIAGSLGKTKELLAYDFCIPARHPLCTLTRRNMSYPFAMLEPFYLFTHQDETGIAEALMAYAPNLKKLAYNERTHKFDGNYGDRIHLHPGLKTRASTYPGVLASAESQIMRAYRVLSEDPHSRRAVITIHNPVWDAIDGDSKDIPCTLNLQFLIRAGELHCFCTMRSNDVWYGTPHNVMMFTFLQRALAGWLGVVPGLYYHRANSMHLYEVHWETAKDLYKNPEKNDMQDLVIYPNHPTPQATLSRVHTVIRAEREVRAHGEVPIYEEAYDPYELDALGRAAAYLRRKQVYSGI